jgi:hypothetical protein
MLGGAKQADIGEDHVPIVRSASFSHGAAFLRHRRFLSGRTDFRGG